MNAMRFDRRVVLAALLVPIMSLTGCSSDEQSAVPANSAPPVAPVTEAVPTAIPEPQAQPAPPAVSQPHVISAVVTQWQPAVLFVEPGEPIVFRQMAGHDTEAIAGLLPDGAQGWKSKLGQEGFSVTLTVPGAYIYKCNPHASMGMVAAIVVGPHEPANLVALEASPLAKGMVGRAVRLLRKSVAAPP